MLGTKRSVHVIKVCHTFNKKKLNFKKFVSYQKDIEAIIDRLESYKKEKPMIPRSDLENCKVIEDKNKMPSIKMLVITRFY